MGTELLAEYMATFEKFKVAEREHIEILLAGTDEQLSKILHQCRIGNQPGLGNRRIPRYLQEDPTIFYKRTFLGK